MAVYNGGAFLERQLASIVEQDFTDWMLYIRDDSSTDDSRDIIETFTIKDRRIHVVSDVFGRLGVNRNFSTLLTSSEFGEHRYIAFADQDDVWREDKLSRQIETMHQLERRFPDSPLLVHSDMEVVDASLRLISPSFMAYQAIRHETREPLRVLLAQNFVTGCTIMANRRLLEIALPISEDALMHDWWLALCAAAMGHIGYIDEALVRYRQHGNNAVGAKSLVACMNPISGAWKKRWKEGRDHLWQSMLQARALADSIRQHDPGNKWLALVEAYASLPYDRPVKRIAKLKEIGVHTQSPVRNMLLLSRLLFAPSGHVVR